MSAVKVELEFRYRPISAESIEQRHAEIVGNMKHIGPPLGFADLEIPPAPVCKGYSASFKIKFPTTGLKGECMYVNREPRFGMNLDRHRCDDVLIIDFRMSNKRLDYKSLLHVHCSRVIEAFRGYRLRCFYSDFEYLYQKPSPKYHELMQNFSLDVNGRNNIFTLYPTQFWDGELCQRALGCDADEVVARLQGQVPKLEPLMDGVYIVLNDDPDLTLEAFIEMNDRFKSVLGLH